MEERLSKLIQAYQCAVAEAVELMKSSGIAMPVSNRAWALNGIPHLGHLSPSVPYRKHGYGCEVKLPSGAIDFDFGPSGEITGVDLWRMGEFAKGKLQQYGFGSAQELESAFNASVQAGELLRVGNLYFLGGHAA